MTSASADLEVLGLAGRPGRRGAGVGDPRVRVEARGVRHRDPRAEHRPLEGPAEVPVAGEPQPAALGVADPQPLDGRRVLLRGCGTAGEYGLARRGERIADVVTCRPCPDPARHPACSSSSRRGTSRTPSERRSPRSARPTRTSTSSSSTTAPATDTAERAAAAGAAVCRLPFNLGVGGAMRTGYRYALRHGYDVAVQIDADGQHDPRYLADADRRPRRRRHRASAPASPATDDPYSVRGPRRWAMVLLARVLSPAGAAPGSPTSRPASGCPTAGRWPSSPRTTPPSTSATPSSPSSSPPASGCRVDPGARRHAGPRRPAAPRPPRCGRRSTCAAPSSRWASPSSGAGPPASTRASPATSVAHPDRERAAR